MRRARYMSAMPSISLFAFCVLLSSNALGAAGRPAPGFRDYTVRSIYRGPTHALLPEYKNAAPKSGIVDGSQRKADFAGHYVAIQGSCGTGCSSFGAMDAKTGEIHWFPHTLILDEHSKLPKVRYLLTSKLLVLHCNLDEKPNTLGTYYYVFEARRFVRLRFPCTRR